jgi:signal transduction histidine kinase
MPDRPPRILHVDDDEANRYAVTRSLVKAGYEVAEAATGSDALREVDDLPDLVILDVRLPDIDGYEVCRRIKGNPATSQIPVLHLSASFITSSDKAHGLNGGADAYLVRPVEPVELLATVNALLRTRRAEAALRDAKVEAETSRDAAETANRLKDDFLATLSHELRTPLNAIVGWTQILRDPDTPKDVLAEGLETIERNAKVQAQLIEDLLDISRIISGKLRLEVQAVDLVGVIRSAVASVAPAADARGVRIEQTLDPAAAAVTGDPARLQQVAWNLLSNAVKFTPRDGRVRVALARVDSHVEFTVADTGRGIEPAFLPYVFDRFRQADASTKRTQGGLGLGLAIVRQLVELHGGTVAASSAGPDRGATFTVTLPLSALKAAPPDAARPDQSIPALAAAVRPCDLTGLRLLIVDDDPDSLTVLARLLETCGARVVTAGGAADALAALATGPFDVVVSDIGMPGQDGYDLIREIRALPADRGGRTPAIALTAFARTEDRQRALAAGFQIHATKPVDRAELTALIASLTGRALGNPS